MAGQEERALLALNGVACVRGERMLFDHLDLALGAGAAAVVTGPNGSGKSSLVRIAAGLLRPFAGTVTHGGRVALLAERSGFDPELPLRRVARFWAGLDGDPGGAEASLARVGLDHLGEVPVRLLSTGQRQRAALARVLAADAPLWLLDEPANGLDAGGVALLETLIAEHRSSGGVVLVATHLPIALPDAFALRLGAP